ncbi:hypothetical protein ACIPWY_15085 [Streptomyces sp. NPDC090032]|uniref:hypothetical protein n=1 Tax=Streptomyces sp. NPDC090032 TaxID=3365925 RepID=UPI0037FBC484
MPIDPYAVLRALLRAEAVRDGRAGRPARPVRPARETPKPTAVADDKTQDTDPRDRA